MADNCRLTAERLRRMAANCRLTAERLRRMADNCRLTAECLRNASLNRLRDLTAEVRHLGRLAIALEAKLNVAREVVLAHTRLATTHTERGQRGVRAVDTRQHKLHLAERTQRRHHRATHVAQNTRTRGIDRRHRSARTEVRPGGRRERATVRAGVTGALRTTPINLASQIRQGDEIAIAANLLCLGEEGRHLLYPFLRINF